MLPISDWVGGQNRLEKIKQTMYCIIRHKRNNLFITCYKQHSTGLTLFTESIGRVGFRGPKKRTLFAAQQVGISAKYSLNALNRLRVSSSNEPPNQDAPLSQGGVLPKYYTLVVEGYLSSKVRGALGHLRASNYPLHSIWIKPIQPHNGIRARKQVRTKRKRRRR